jgi:hypothetical protein
MKDNVKVVVKRYDPDDIEWHTPDEGTSFIQDYWEQLEIELPVEIWESIKAQLSQIKSK